jgi:DNA polymerase-3 subunit gamma/tau
MISLFRGFHYTDCMSYLVLARKYRPGTFEDVVAQEHVTRTLRNALKHDRIGSGYLFCGPRGTGKTTVARILAKAINCAEGPTEHPCGKCPACMEITAGASLDVLEIDAASNTGVDDIRTLRENVRYLPTSGKKRIYIIDEVHRLSGSAFDALLKTLEEPPPHVMFIFATTEPMKIPETILSRTQRFDFRRVSVDDLAGHVKNIAAKEELRIEDAAIHLIARKADGSVRDSLSLLDQIAAFAGSDISELDIVNALGLVDRQFLFDFINAIAEADKSKSLQMIKRLFDEGVDIGDFVSELLEHLRALLVLATDESASDLLNLSEAELADYKTQAQHFSVGDVLLLMKIVADLNPDLRTGINERLLLEIAAVKMAGMESTVRLEEVLARLAETNVADNSEVTSGPSDPDMFGSSPQKKNHLTAGNEKDQKPESAVSTPAVLTRSINLPQVKAGWERFLTLLRENNRMLASQLSMAELRAIKDNELLLVFSQTAKPSMELTGKPNSIKLVSRALREHYKANLRIKLEIDPEKADPVPDMSLDQTPRVSARELVEGSPRLQRLLKLVDGEIIGVKKLK